MKRAAYPGVDRGDGRKGDEITANMKTIRSLPLELNEKIDIEVRGEVYMPHQVFQALNAQKEAAGKNPGPILAMRRLVLSNS